MPLIRHLFTLILTLAVILTGAETAVARAEMAAATTPVLCGAAETGLTFDPMGHPLAHRSACPHCLAAGVQVLGPDPAPAELRPLDQRLVLILWPAPDVPARLQSRPRPEARGPPAAI
jgi:hypothetical protein